MFFNLSSMRWFFLIALALVVSAAAYGFAASNTVPASSAGEGSGAVSGFTVTAVHYNLNATTPANIDSVTFTIAPPVPAGGSVKAKLVSAGGTWYSCTVTGGTSVACTTTSPQATAQTTDTLDVVAAQ
ncbi:MAG: hypothetical protein HY782_20075 [Chloroflexi bacterium]|nr:hypothetical protein [Chloroflexota bacterium]